MKPIWSCTQLLKFLPVWNCVIINYGVVNLEWRQEVLLYDNFCFSFELFAPIKTWCGLNFPLGLEKNENRTSRIIELPNIIRFSKNVKMVTKILTKSKIQFVIIVTLFSKYHCHIGSNTWIKFKWYLIFLPQIKDNFFAGLMLLHSSSN